MMARTDPPMVVMIGARTNVPEESCGKSSGVLSLHVLHGTKKGI